VTWLELHNAQTALQANPGAGVYTVDHLLVDTSRQMLTLGADGALSHLRLSGLGGEQSVDPVQISNASPHFANALADNCGGADIFVVSGAVSSAVFDHMDVTSAHCAFHFNAGSDVTISNSNIHGNSYALMVEASQNTRITDSNLSQNTINVGTCAGGIVRISGSYIVGQVYDVTCASQPAPASPAGGPVPGVGPTGL
jgi:hypothetical protein